MLGNEFVSHTRKRLGTLHVNTRWSGEIEHYELRRCRLSANTAQDYVDHIVHVEIDETRFRPENHYSGDELIVLMSFAIGEVAGAGNSTKHSAAWPRGCMEQLYKRDHSPDHHAEEQTKREHADESRYRHDKLRTIASPELLHG
jgi:hypothetical protein